MFLSRLVYCSFVDEDGGQYYADHTLFKFVRVKPLIFGDYGLGCWGGKHWVVWC